MPTLSMTYRLDRQTQLRVIEFLKSLEQIPNPRLKGKRLKGKYKNLWRYRIGDYRLIAKIEDNIFTILVIRVSHRKNVYRKIKLKEHLSERFSHYSEKLKSLLLSS